MTILVHVCVVVDNLQFLVFHDLVEVQSPEQVALQVYLGQSRSSCKSYCSPSQGFLVFLGMCLFSGERSVVYLVLDLGAEQCQDCASGRQRGMADADVVQLEAPAYVSFRVNHGDIAR